MIKVINRKVEEHKIYKITCYECRAELEFEKRDTHIGALGGRELICPVCNQTVFVDEIEGIDLDSSNIEFPTHFMKPSDEAVDIEDKKIQEWVVKCLKKIEDNPDSGFYISGSGNTVVIALDFEDEREIYVAKKYWECSIPK